MSWLWNGKNYNHTLTFFMEVFPLCFMVCPSYQHVTFHRSIRQGWPVIPLSCHTISALRRRSTDSSVQYSWFFQLCPNPRLSPCPGNWHSVEPHLSKQRPNRRQWSLRTLMWRCLFMFVFQVQSGWILPHRTGGLNSGQSVDCGGDPVRSTGHTQRVWRQQHRDCAAAATGLLTDYHTEAFSNVSSQAIYVGHKWPPGRQFGAPALARMKIMKPN